MSANEKLIIQRYSTRKEDGRENVSRTVSMEFHYTKKHLEGFIKPDFRILEVGCATGYYGFQYAPVCREYVGVDIVPEHIDIFREKIERSGLGNISCELGDATDLRGITDASFDVVLCLGPMYHLNESEREKCFSECRRVCRDGGIAAFAYINEIGVYAGACIVDDRYPSEAANHFVLEKHTDDVQPDIFYFTTPEDMNAAAERHGFEKIKNLGTDFFVMMNVADPMTDEQFEVLRPLYDRMTSYESCTGMSNHALLLCMKV